MRGIFFLAALGLTLSFSALAQVTPLLKPFPDVPASHPYAEAILFLQANGVIQGNPDGTFRPDTNINRAEFTKILVESLAEQSVIETCLQDKPALFSDVNPQEWFAKYICVAKKFKMAFGNPDGTFRPGNPINFVEAATLIARNLGVVNQLPQPVSDWYRPFVEGMGFEHAIPMTITHLAQPITRGEMAEMIYRIKADIPLKTSQTYESLVELSKKPYAPPVSSASSKASTASGSVASASTNSVQSSSRLSTSASAITSASSASTTSQGGGLTSP
jgi:hypothetical protein